MQLSLTKIQEKSILWGDTGSDIYTQKCTRRWACQLCMTNFQRNTVNLRQPQLFETAAARTSVCATQESALVFKRQLSTGHDLEWVYF